MAEATIHKLADARLVVTERDAASGRETVEVAHEALIRDWQRLRGWVDQDREFLRTRDRIAAQAQLWEDEGRPRDRLLPLGRPLAEGEDLLATRRADLDPELIAYIEASAEAAKAEEDAARAAQRRRLWYARLAAAVMFLFAATAGVFAYWANLQWQTAQRNESRALASLAENEVERGSPATAVRLALTALPRSLTAPDRPMPEKRKERSCTACSTCANGEDFSTRVICRPSPLAPTGAPWPPAQGITPRGCGR